MEDDIIEIRNRNAYYYDYDDEWRNGGPRNRRVVVQGNRPGPWTSSPPPGAFQRPTAPVPVAYAQPVPVAAARVLNQPPGTLIDVAAQMLAAFSQLPPPPTVNAGGDAAAATQNLTNLIEYQRALAAYQKRNEQIRTAGALAKLLMA